MPENCPPRLKFSWSNNEGDSAGTFFSVFLPSFSNAGSRRIRGVDWAMGLEDSSSPVSATRVPGILSFSPELSSLGLKALLSRSGKGIERSSCSRCSKSVGLRVFSSNWGGSEKGSSEVDFRLLRDLPSSGKGFRRTLPWPVRWKTLVVLYLSPIHKCQNNSGVWMLGTLVQTHLHSTESLKCLKRSLGTYYLGGESAKPEALEC